MVGTWFSFFFLGDIWDSWASMKLSSWSWENPSSYSGLVLETETISFSWWWQECAADNECSSAKNCAHWQWSWNHHHFLQHLIICFLCRANQGQSLIIELLRGCQFLEFKNWFSSSVIVVMLSCSLGFCVWIILENECVAGVGSAKMEYGKCKK